MPKKYTSKGLSFSQGYSSKGKGGRGGDNKIDRDNKTFDKNYWRDKECYECRKQGHPTSHCTTVKKDKNDNDKSTKNNDSIASVKILRRM